MKWCTVMPCNGKAAPCSKVIPLFSRHFAVVTQLLWLDASVVEGDIKAPKGFGGPVGPSGPTSVHPKSLITSRWQSNWLLVGATTFRSNAYLSPGTFEP